MISFQYRMPRRPESSLIEALGRNASQDISFSSMCMYVWYKGLYQLYFPASSLPTVQVQSWLTEQCLHWSLHTECYQSSMSQPFQVWNVNVCTLTKLYHSPADCSRPTHCPYMSLYTVMSNLARETSTNCADSDLPNE